MDSKCPRIALVTGASSGIGREFACALAQQHAFTAEADSMLYRGSKRQKALMRSMVEGLDEIWLVARRKDRLKKLKHELQELNPELSYKVISCDLGDEQGLAELTAQLTRKNPELHFLINAAGWGLLQRLALSDSASLQSMLKVNCMATLEMCYQCLPYAVRGCKIINIASSAAFLPLIGSSVYAASKSFVLNFSRALNYELKDVGITVLAVCPKVVATEFWDHVGSQSHIRQSARLFGVETPQDVVRQALIDASKEKDLSISSIQAKSLYFGARFVPTSLSFYLQDKLGLS